ncbi:hypothetical protein PQ455_01350 [Sphingomonas naphthae]|uniref:Uncharacterized protein n=1 Tax=Sphingomonas naphthae TaxID=1813468 RepID=A0ABY7TKZ1_9SPHN|nr:hypothetical protein [Sphingomonas naphthae]WCT73907.1 hypothetical protein PQ455_01350 [Sphingomonas naphthae]
MHDSPSPEAFAYAAEVLISCDMDDDLAGDRIIAAIEAAGLDDIDEDYWMDVADAVDILVSEWAAQ